MPPSFSHPIPRVALIGITGYGRIHLQLARECQRRGELRLVAATVINPAESAEEVAALRREGCEICDDHEAMLAAHAGRIDLCLVPTGIHWHARMTIAALRAGANVLVEKPLSSVQAEVTAVQVAERETGRFVAVGFQDYYDPVTSWLKSCLVGGAIGRVRTIRFLGLWPRARNYFGRNSWAGRLRVDGQAVFDSPLSNAFAHFAMLSFYFAGHEQHEVADPRLVDAELFRVHAIETFDTAVARLLTPQQTELWFGVTHACQVTVEPEIVIAGESGEAGWRYEREAWWMNASGERQSQALPDASGARRAMMAATLRRLTDPAAVICTTGRAAAHTRFVEELHQRFPVRNIPTDHVRWSRADGEGQPKVARLELALRSAHRDGSTLARQGFATAEVAAQERPG